MERREEPRAPARELGGPDSGPESGLFRKLGFCLAASDPRCRAPGRPVTETPPPGAEGCRGSMGPLSWVAGAARGAPRGRFAGAAGLLLLGEAALCALLVLFVPCAPPPAPPPPVPRAHSFPLPLPPLRPAGPPAVHFSPAGGGAEAAAGAGPLSPVAGATDTKIDWDAYMEQVALFEGGERDYMLIRGDTGPLVYPGGFLWAFSGIRWLTGGLVPPAQVFFAGLYVLTLSVVLAIYRSSNVPLWALGLLTLSRRLHSIYVLRLFNDGVAMLPAFAAVLALQRGRWRLGLLLFSAAVSVKMNSLLMAPGLAVLLLQVGGLPTFLPAVAGAAVVQLLAGLPFLTHSPGSYLSRAFELSRVFMWKWSVNFKFIPEDIFVTKPLAVALLMLHLGLLLAFAHWKWTSKEGGLLELLLLQLRRRGAGKLRVLDPEYVATVMFVGNFVGIAFARSLHFQFYSWYYFTLPWLLWQTRLPAAAKVLLLVSIEACFNATDAAGEPVPLFSSILTVCHLVLLAGLWHGATLGPVEGASHGKKKVL